MTDEPRDAPARRADSLTTEQVAEVLRLLKRVDGVELKLSVPDEGRVSAVRALGMDPLDAQIRQVYFLDTPDLALDRQGVVVRVRRVQRKSADAVVKLRPIVPDQLASSVRKSAFFSVEIDAMPGGYVCSATLKSELDDADVLDAVAGHRPIRKLFSKEQQALYTAYAPDGVALDDLTLLGPVNVLKLKFTPKGFPHRMVAELWNYPDGSRLLELSTKCEPAEAFDMASKARTFLMASGVDVTAEQQTKTRKALQFFASTFAEVAAR